MGGFVVDTAGAPRTIGNLQLRIVGPTQANLEALAAEWKEWLDAHDDAVNSGDPFAMANSDQSIPNLSSILVLAEANGKSILLTGDGRSDHLISGLERAGVLPAGGSLHVDVLKLPHHGSNRNITKKFFKTVTADRYVASANGKDDNPDLTTLIWVVEAARDQHRQPEIVGTNKTLSTAKLLEEYSPNDFGYTLRVLPLHQFGCAHRTNPPRVAVASKTPSAFWIFPAFAGCRDDLFGRIDDIDSLAAGLVTTRYPRTPRAIRGPSPGLWAVACRAWCASPPAWPGRAGGSRGRG